MNLMRTLLLALPLIAQPVFAGVDVRAVDEEMFPSNVSYDPSIPRPADILGHRLGEEPVRHHKLVEYITTVAEASPRLSVEVIGHTHERRPILFVVATSEANRARLDEIKAQHVALSEPSQNQPVTDDMPVVSWLNYGVHGAEESGMDASLPFVYYLAAAQDEKLEEILNNSVILVTAIFNPDGHSARAAWLDSWGGERNISDPAHMEHGFSWTFARTNHYGFDLNRQWLLLTQPEPRAWMKKWHEWRPNLTVDYHEMGSASTYYFHPGIATRTNPLVPDEAERLMEKQVGTSEDFLDGEGRLYFHGERFDNYYIGKGSTFPLVNGGVGVLYEAAAALGREIDTDSGLRTYRENIRKHFRTSIASIEAASAMRVDYLNYQKSFYANALNSANNQDTKAWVFSSPGDPVRLHMFADLLNYHRIKTYRPARDINAGGNSYSPDDALIVPVAQPQNTLIRSIFEFNKEFEDSTFYDVSTWTLPPAFGLQYASLGRSFRTNLVGDEYAPPMPVAPEPDKATFAYVFEWGGYYAPRALQRVVESGLLARAATKPFSATTSNGVVTFSRGAIAVPFDRQKKSQDKIHALMQKIAAEDGIAGHAIMSGRSANGTQGIEIGGPSFHPVKQPKTLLVMDPMAADVSLYDAGEVWHLLDYRMNMPVTIRDRDGLAGINWSKYTHIVLPSGNYDGYAPGYLPRLRQWVAEGGTLIAMGNATEWVRANTLDWVDPMSEGYVPPEPEEEEEEPVERSAYADKSDEEAVDVIGGAIFAADLDNTHPLGFGFPTRAIHVHKNRKDPMEPTDNPWGTVIAYADDPVASGYVSHENSEALAGTPALIAERSGNGTIILFADNPNFRGYWYATNKLFLNSLFFSRAFDAPRPD